MRSESEVRARGLLANCLDDWGYPTEAENVRNGQDLGSYEQELRLIRTLLRFGLDTPRNREKAALASQGEQQGDGALSPDQVHAMAPAGLSWTEAGARGMGYNAALASQEKEQHMSSEPKAVAWQYRCDDRHNGFQDDFWLDCGQGEFEELSAIIGDRPFARLAKGDGPWREDMGGWPIQIRPLYGEQALSALRAEVEALREDAQRYRWLKRRDIAIGHLGHGEYELYAWTDMAAEYNHDSVIDAAMENPA